ncbi:MAG: gamma-glutamyl-gamma-aminobutyrate hydrolase family protein [Litoreibacter sp.]
MTPVVGIVADRIDSDGVDQDLVRTRYLEALTKAANVTPVVIPTNLETDQVDAILSKLDGLVLGGSQTNVHPIRYGEILHSRAPLVDLNRDRTVFLAIETALRKQLPVLGICRGLQELNVAFGGTLQQDISSIDCGLRHHEDTKLPRDSQYLPVHKVSIVEHGQIAACVAKLGTSTFKVNSLHKQAISQLGDGLCIDLISDDGVVEAISKIEGETFVAAVQWHPEWHFDNDALSQEIFARFGKSCRRFASKNCALFQQQSVQGYSSGYTVRQPPSSSAAVSVAYLSK